MRPLERAAVVAIAAVTAALAVALREDPASLVVADPRLLFWSVGLGAGLCLGVSVAVVIAGFRRGLAEVALLGSALTTLSAVMVVHGLTAPGYLYGTANSVTATAMVLAFPGGAVAVLPLVIPLAVLTRRWRGFTWGVLFLTVVACGALLARPGLALPSSPIMIWLLAFIVSVVTIMLAARQTRLFLIGRRPASLAAAGTIGALGLAALVGMTSSWDSPAWWAVHLVDTAAAVVLGLVLLVCYRWGKNLEAVLAPIVTREPLAALELGLTPEIHAFVAALERKDPQTRDHVVRTAALAMRLGERAGLPAGRLRNVALAGLLHDIGKLVVPTDILTKSDTLTEAEFATMRTHSERGALLLSRSPALQSVTPLVRCHHERYDGTGYPDGLHGNEIPLDAAIVSVSDAWDAIVNTRHYRSALVIEDARKILLAGAGTQWTPEAVTLLLEEVDLTDHSVRRTLSRVGRGGGSDPADVDNYIAPCLDALPDEVAALGRTALSGT